MALSKIEIRFFAHLLRKGLVSAAGDVLEIGESSTVGDAHALLDLLRPWVPEARCSEAKALLAKVAGSRSLHWQAYGPGRALYHAIFRPRMYLALDAELGPSRVCADLNRPVRLGRTFDYVINNGTSEHVFDQANLFKVMHDHTEIGGLMVHWTPTLGWVNHGLYNVQPNFFWDLARANGYEVAHLELGHDQCSAEIRSANDVSRVMVEHPEFANALLLAALVKRSDAPFMPPVQRDYSNIVEPGLALAAKVAARRGSDRNVGLHKPASQSSTSPWSWSDDAGQDAAGANNGVITGYYGFHTDNEERPWWQVDLEGEHLISKVVVYNRIDNTGTAMRAANLAILTSLDGRRWDEAFRRSGPGTFGGADGHPLLVLFEQPKRGRFLRVQLPEYSCLHLDEVEVYATAA